MAEIEAIYKSNLVTTYPDTYLHSSLAVGSVATDIAPAPRGYSTCAARTPVATQVCTAG